MTKTTTAGTKAAPTEPSASTAVATTSGAQTSALALQEQAVIDLIEEDSPAEFNANELAIPFLKLLQAMSPEVTKASPKYIKGASAGDFCNSLTGDVYDGEAGIYVIPVFHRISITEWIPRNPDGSGGGFVKDHGSNEAILAMTTKNEKNKDVLPSGNELVKASMYYVFVVDPETGAYVRAVMSLSSTQLKYARKWNSIMAERRIQSAKTPGKTFTPAMYYSVFHITAMGESKGTNSWMSHKIALHGDTINLPFGARLYMEAKTFAEQVTSGLVQVKHEDLVDAEVTVAPAATGGVAADSGTDDYTVEDDDVPF